MTPQNDSPHTPPPAAAAAFRAVLDTMLRRMAVLVVLLAVAGSLLGYVVSGVEGLWGALLGAGIAAAFMVATVLAVRLTADKPVHIMNAAIAGGWLAKMLILLVVLLTLRGQDFYSPEVFFVAMVAAVLGPLAIEAQAVLTARLPTVTPREQTETDE